jgi:F0F1-type ATP synthase assembly protein I
MEEKKNKKREYADMARLSSVGIALVVSVAIGYFAGAAIDRYFHTAPAFTIIFIFFGIGAGLLNVFRTLRKYGS